MVPCPFTNFPCNKFEFYDIIICKRNPQLHRKIITVFYYKYLYLHMKNNCIFLWGMFGFLRHFVLFYMYVCICEACVLVYLRVMTHIPHVGVMVTGCQTVCESISCSLLLFTASSLALDFPVILLGWPSTSAVGVLATQVPITVPSNKEFQGPTRGSSYVGFLFS